MPQAWRIVKEKYVASAFSGEGASRVGGRWNSPGVWVVYASSTMALAALETLVHLNPPLFFNYVAIPIQFDDELVEYSPISAMPADWREEPASPSTKRIGDTWAKQRRSSVLALPSAIIPCEVNYLLNPAHPDFKRVNIGKSEPFTFDRRLIE